MLLAELEIWHSRPIAPTRRVALGRRLLPVNPAPGFGGLLLGSIVAVHHDGLEDDLVGDLQQLLADLHLGRRVSQPRLRHRFQADRHGLARSRHRLRGEGERLDLDLDLDLDGAGSPAAQVLGAVYAAGQLDPLHRAPVMAVLRRATRWRGPVGPDLIRHLTGADGRQSWGPAGDDDPSQWALVVLGFDPDGTPARREVQHRFRSLLRAAHPDHGGARDGAADRIAELSAARRILFTP